MLGYKTLRLLSRQIQRERLAGAPICAAVSGIVAGTIWRVPQTSCRLI